MSYQESKKYRADNSYELLTWASVEALVGGLHQKQLQGTFHGMGIKKCAESS